MDGIRGVDRRHKPELAGWLISPAALMRAERLGGADLAGASACMHAYRELQCRPAAPCG